MEIYTRTIEQNISSWILVEWIESAPGPMICSECHQPFTAHETVLMVPAGDCYDFFHEAHFK